MFCEISVLKNFAKLLAKHLCQSLFIKRETLTRVFSCEFCDIFKSSTSFYRTLLVAASENYMQQKEVSLCPRLLYNCWKLLFYLFPYSTNCFHLERNLFCFRCYFNIVIFRISNTFVNPVLEDDELIY